MKKVFLKATGLLLAATVLMTAAAGCGSDKTKNEADNSSAAPSSADSSATVQQEKSPKDEFAKLIWYQRSDTQKDFDKVLNELNKQLKEKQNTELDLIFVPAASYNEKLKMVISSNENYDICFTGAGYNDYFGNAGKGAFLPLNDLLQTYAPKTYAQVPKDFWSAVAIKDNIYGVINYQIVGREAGVYVLKSYVDKYNFDMSKVTKFEDIEGLLETIKKNEPELYPFDSAKEPMYIVDGMVGMGIDEVGKRHSPGVVQLNDSSLEVVNQYELPAYVERLKIIRSWYDKGYISKDAATNMTSSARLEGKVPVAYGNIKPGSEVEVKASFGGGDIVIAKFDDAFVNTSSIAATLNAISQNSKYPEKSMMLLELVNTDKDFYNMLCFGIENTHYKKTGENQIERIEDSGYYPNKAWAFGCQFNAYLLPGQPEDIWERTKKLNESAIRSELLGFVFDPTPVNTEIAQCSAVIDEFGPGLWTGSIDPDKYLAEMNKKLKAAGSEKIIAEKQKQIDAWKSAGK